MRATPASSRRGRSRRRTGKDSRRSGSSSMSADARWFRQMPGLEQVEYLTNSSMMNVDFLPARLIIVGGSYIGLEFGQMFRRFGSEVTIVEMGAAPGSARGRRCLRGHPGDSRTRRHRRSAEREVHRLFQARRRRLSRASDCSVGSRRSNRHASAAGGGAATQYRRPGAGEGRRRGG